MAREKKGNGRSELMGKILRYAGVLTAVCLLSGAGVSLLYVTNMQRIERQEGKALANALDTVIGDAVDPQPVEGAEGVLWVADRPGNDGVRYVAEGTARGYQSDITVLVSADADSPQTPVPEETPIFRLVAMPTAETPGLGENIHAVERTVSLWEALAGKREEPQRPAFQTQFEGKTAGELRLEDDAGRITPVTGATETSEAATEAARAALRRIIDTTRELYSQ